MFLGFFEETNQNAEADENEITNNNPINIVGDSINRGISIRNASLEMATAAAIKMSKCKYMFLLISHWPMSHE